MKDIAYLLIVIYFIMSQLCTLWFWYIWAQTHSFLNSLFLGPIVSELKGIFWPFFI